MTPVESDDELTRKQRREQARSDRKALEQAELASAARRSRMRQIGIVGAVVVVAIVGVLIATGGGSKGHAVSSHSAAATKTSSQVTSLIGNIPQNGNTLGNPNAPVTLQYFGDLQCPICRDFSLGALPPIIKKWVATGKVKIEYRALETATREPETFKLQQVAALAAGKQSKMWHYIELFYHEQGEEATDYVNEAYLQGLAEQIPGLNLPKWTAARGDTALAAQVAADGQAANAAGFNGTPSFLLGKTGGAMKKFEYTSLTDPASFNEAIEQLLKA